MMRVPGLGSFSADAGHAGSGPVPNVRLCVLYAALFFELGVSTPFFPVWLQSRALGPAEIGIILSVPLLVRLLANPLVTTLADRRDLVAGLLGISAIGMAVATPLLALTHGFATILIVVMLIAFAQGPLIALCDAFTWAQLRRSHVFEHQSGRYGAIRVWGSIGFVVAGILAGQLLEYVAPYALIWLLCGASLVVMLAALSMVTPHLVGSCRRGLWAAGRLASRPAMEARPQQALGWRELLPLACVIAGAAGIQASHAMYYGFASLHWLERGIASTHIGVLWAIGVIAEIGFFGLLIFRRPLSGRSGTAVLSSPMVMLGLGAGGSVMRWSLMSFDLPLPLLALLQTSHALTFGATHVGSMAFISRHVPLSMQARAQGWLAALWAGFAAGLTALCGLLYHHIGAATFLTMALVAVAACGLICLGRMVGQDARRGKTA